LQQLIIPIEIYQIHGWRDDERNNPSEINLLLRPDFLSWNCTEDNQNYAASSNLSDTDPEVEGASLLHDFHYAGLRDKDEVYEGRTRGKSILEWVQPSHWNIQ